MKCLICYEKFNYGFSNYSCLKSHVICINCYKKDKSDFCCYCRIQKKNTVIYENGKAIIIHNNIKKYINNKWINVNDNTLLYKISYIDKKDDTLIPILILLPLFLIIVISLFVCYLNILSKSTFVYEIIDCPARGMCSHVAMRIVCIFNVSLMIVLFIYGLKLLLNTIKKVLFLIKRIHKIF